MKAVSLSAFLLSVAMVPLVGCHKSDNKNPIANVREAAADRDLQSRIFRGECDVRVVEAITSALATAGKFSLKSSREQFQFVGANFTRATSFYESANCQGDEALVFKETGSFDIDQNKRGQDQSKFINMKSARLVLLAANEVGARVANETKMCGREDWQSGKEHEVTGQAKEMTCYRRAIPVQEMNLYRLDGNTLYFGDPAKEGEARPTQVKTTTKYIAD